MQSELGDSLSEAFTTLKMSLHTPLFPGPVETYRRTSVRIGRNMLCPCGSGLKYKNCCLGKKKEEDHGTS